MIYEGRVLIVISGKEGRRTDTEGQGGTGCTHWATFSISLGFEVKG